MKRVGIVFKRHQDDLMGEKAIIFDQDSLSYIMQGYIGVETFAYYDPFDYESDRNYNIVTVSQVYPVTHLYVIDCNLLSPDSIDYVVKDACKYLGLSTE